MGPAWALTRAQARQHLLPTIGHKSLASGQLGSKANAFAIHLRAESSSIGSPKHAKQSPMVAPKKKQCVSGQINED